MTEFAKRDESTRLPKLLIGVPCHDRPHVECMFSVWAVGRDYAGAQGLQFARNSIVANGRNMLVLGALELGMEYLFMCDTDMSFPVQTIRRLLSHNVDIVGCAYRRRGPPYDIQVGKLRPDDPETGLQEVEKCATGIMLIKMSVFKDMKMPYFRFIPDEGLQTHWSEDYTFCKMARELGFKVHCDWDLSQHIRHYFEYGIGLADSGLEAAARAEMKRLEETGHVRAA